MKIPEKKDFILNLYQAKNTVFTIDEIALLSGEIERFNLKSKINYYVKKGDLRNVRKGIYTKIEYDPLELATKIFTPSYISLETVLKKEGVIFQTYETIFIVSYLKLCQAISYSTNEKVNSFKSGVSILNIKKEKKIS